MNAWLEAAECIREELLRWRRTLHRNPELSMKEYMTADFVERELRAAGITQIRRIGETGILAEVSGDDSGEAVLLRGDMDALPGMERTRLSFSSKNPEVMHACGHDVHTACLLGAAKILKEYSESLNGAVKFVFQPAEEIAQGARMMIEGGVLENPSVSAAAMLHCWPGLPAGSVGICYGTTSAAADSLTIIIEGKQGHGAHPHQSVDAVFIAGHIITALQGLVSREISPMQNAVLSLCKIEGSLAPNIIAGQLTIEGTLRTLNPELRRFLHGRLQDVAGGIAQAFRGKACVKIEVITPALAVDTRVTDLLVDVAEELVGQKHVYVFSESSMGSEDFAFFSERVPSTAFRLGTGFVGVENPPLHSDMFLVNEECLSLGTAMLCAFAEQALNRKNITSSG